jgi:predicted CXXCH cytochrome family protein
MDKIVIVIWLWFLGTDVTVKQDQLNQDTTNDHIYIVNTKTIFASTESIDWQGEYPHQTDSVKSCKECHDDMLVGENIHAPAKKDCQRCHVTNGTEHPLKDEAGFTLKADVPSLCYECHDPKDEKEFVHDPISKGDCLTCHDIHNSPNLYLVKEDPVGGLCLDCHDLEIPEGDLVHGAVSDGDCVGCHNPHQADNASFMKSSKLDRLCRSCHKPIRKQLKMAVVHDPFKKKDCFECHNAHSSKEAHLSDFKLQDLCYSCHEDTHNIIKNAKLVHNAVNETNTCLNCHVPHASEEPHILLSKEKDMCLTCHNKPIATLTDDIEAIGPKLKEGNKVHEPIETDGCTICHQPHASAEHTLLSKTFPIKNYTNAIPDNFGLCLDCHDKELFTSPFTETATNFRNGDQNLHYVHIQGEKGRNCNFCHDIHGAENSYLIKERTQFGRWEMPIEFKLNDNGGSCLTGCHQKHSYERIVLPDSVIQRD